MEIGTAGVPVDLAQTRDYDLIFGTLADAGIEVFLPYSVYEEIPVRRGYDFEADFYPPPFGSATSEIYDLARTHGIKIMLSADLMYPSGAMPVDPANDPLQAIIDAGARDVIHSVYSFDEPVFRGITVAQSRDLYEHIKSVDPTIEVQQVQAHVGSDVDPSAYLDLVLQHAEFADVVGFDIYPIYVEAGAQSPYSGGEILSPVKSLQDYVRWLEENLSDKKHTMVLQAFEKSEIYSLEAFNALPLAEQADTRDPTELEMRAMLLAVEGVDQVFWWGPSHQQSQNDPVWQSVLSISEQAIAGTLNLEMSELVDTDMRNNSVVENASAGTVTGIRLSATDPDDRDTISYTTDDDRFYVDDFGQVRVAANAILNFEAEPSVNFTATAVSTDGFERTLDLTLELENAIDVISGTSGSDSIQGDTGVDHIQAGLGNDLVYAGGDDDDVDAGGGSDAVLGEDGDDTLRGNEGNDYLDGGLGNDIISGGHDNDQIIGGGGNDQLDGDLGDDAIFGQEGNDTLVGHDGTDYLDGGIGNDDISGGDGNDQIIGGDGDDYLDGDQGNDSIAGGSGADTINGGGGDDQIMGGAGRDDMTGGFGNDYLSGDDGGDTISGGDGSDFVLGGSGDDRITGGNQTDSLFGGDGNDNIQGEDGDDYIDGGIGTDQLFGGSGTDQMIGAGGGDTLVGGAGDDQLSGGSGADIFHFENGDGDDIIFDFSVAEDFLRFGGATSSNDLTISAFLNHTNIEYGSDSVLLIGVEQDSWADIDYLFT